MMLDMAAQPDTTDYSAQRIQLEEAINSSYPLSIYTAGKLEHERWDKLYHQILQRPQEFLTINTHAEHLLSEFHMCIFQYYRYMAPMVMLQKPTESTRRELMAHYWFTKAYTWACLLYHRHEYQAWTYLEMIDAMLPEQSLPLTLMVALALTEDAEQEIVIPVSIEYKLSRIAPFYSMTPSSDGGYIRVLVPSTLTPLHIGATDPQTLVPAISESFYLTMARQLDAMREEDWDGNSEPAVADIILDITIGEEEIGQEKTETRLPVASNA